MGIPHYYRMIRDHPKYRGVLRKNVPRYVSSFSVEMNALVHETAQQVYAYGEGTNLARQKLIAGADPRILEAELYNAISVLLQTILAQVQPTEILGLFFDGPAPQAKINQQRQRRFRNAMGRSEVPIFDSNSITPGTDFMIRLDNFIQRWLVTYQHTLPPKVIYSSHLVPGEGEHKIMDMMRSGEITGEGAHVLYGMDADLIMLSMIAPLEHIHLMRQDISDVIDIDSLKLAIQEELVLPTAIQDYVVMLFTIGNDFLPHSPTLENMEEAIKTLIEVYKATGRSLTSGNELDFQGLAIYLTNLAKEEPRLLEGEAVRDVKYPSRMLGVATTRTERISDVTPGMIANKKVTFETKFDFPTFRGAWYQNALTPKGDTSVLQKILPEYNFGVTMDKVVDMCQQYLTGMAWIYAYYTQGTAAINNNFVYRYHHTPLFIDLASVLSQTKVIEGYLAEADQLVMNPIHQLLAVLPLPSKDLLPREVSHLMSKDSPIADYYPAEAIIEMDAKNADWQGVVLISFVDPLRIIEAVNSTTMFSLERAQLYSQASNIVMIRDPEMAALDAQKKHLKQFLGDLRPQGRGQGRGRGNQARNQQQGGNQARNQQQGGNQARNQQQGGNQARNQQQGRGQFRDQQQGQGRGRNQQQGRGQFRNQQKRDYQQGTRDTPMVRQVLSPQATPFVPSRVPPVVTPVTAPSSTMVYQQPRTDLPPVPGSAPPVQLNQPVNQTTGNVWKPGTTIF